LSLFGQNEFEKQKQLANSLVRELVGFVRDFDSSFVSGPRDSPPFDLLLLTFMVSSDPAGNHTLLVSLFQHYTAVLGMVKASSGSVHLNDRNQKSEMQCDTDSAISIVRARVDYLAELTVSLLHSNGQHLLLQAFLAELCPPSFTDCEGTLSHLGRMALACGDARSAALYFAKVQDGELVSAN